SLIVAGPGGRPAIAPPLATMAPRPSNAASPLTGAPGLAIVGRDEVCVGRGSLVVLPAADAVRASAWVTCATNSFEVVLGTDTVTSPPGGGTIAVDRATEWAIRGDAAVELNADRSIARSVRIGTPSSIAVG